MSDLRVAIIAEGPTDEIIISAALKAILTRPFVPNLIQPEPTRPQFGGGWCGVLKWCADFAARGFPSLEEDPTLSLYDLFVIQLDADVADFSYADGGVGLPQVAQQEGWEMLPCSHPCPPPEGAVNNLKPVLLSWLHIPAIGDRTVLCIPSKSSEAWLASAVYPANHGLMAGIECSLDMAGRLAQLPKGRRIKKTAREYRNHEKTVEAAWPAVRRMCTRADAFHQEIDAVVKRLPNDQ